MMRIAVFSMVLAVAAAGVVGPVTDCGGVGQTHQLRITDCEGPPPCTIIPHEEYLIEGDFTASADSEMAKFELIARTTSGQEIPVVEGTLGSLVGGLTYTASQAIRISQALSGQTVVAQIRVMDLFTQRVEVCVQAGMAVQ